MPDAAPPALAAERRQPGEARTYPPPGLRRALCELVLAMALVLGYSWLACSWSLPVRLVYVLSGGVIAVMLVLSPVGGHRLRWQDWGLGWEGMAAHALALLLPIVVLTFACAAIAPDPEETIAALVVRAFGYLPWALLQNAFVLCLVGNRLLLLLQSQRSATWTTGLLFGFLHLPNPELTAATTVLGLLFAALFSWRRCILVIALSHALLGAMADDILDWNLRVGERYEVHG